MTNFRQTVIWTIHVGLKSSIFLEWAPGGAPIITSIHECTERCWFEFLCFTYTYDIWSVTCSYDCYVHIWRTSRKYTTLWLYGGVTRFYGTSNQKIKKTKKTNTLNLGVFRVCCERTWFLVFYWRCNPKGDPKGCSIPKTTSTISNCCIPTYLQGHPSMSETYPLCTRDLLN